MIDAKLSPIRMGAKLMCAQTGLFLGLLGLGRAGSSEFAFYNRENQPCFAIVGFYARNIQAMHFQITSTNASHASYFFPFFNKK